MNIITINPSCGLFFSKTKPLPDPDANVRDLGLRMQWEKRTARLYRNVQESRPESFRHTDVVVHESDVDHDIDYHEAQARETKHGKFLPLDPFLTALHRAMQERPIFSTLAELDELLPPETPPDPPSFRETAAKLRLIHKLSAKGFRVTNRVPGENHVFLDIGWFPRPEGRKFFTGIVDMWEEPDGIVGHWVKPGLDGIHELLVEQFKNYCASVQGCLMPVAFTQCFQGIKPRNPRSKKRAKPQSAWLANSQPKRPLNLSEISRRKTSGN